MSVAGNETDLNFVLPLVETNDCVFFRVPSMTKDDWEYLVIILASLNFDQKKFAHHDAALLTCFRIPSASASSYDLSICTNAFASVLGVIDLRVQINTSKINEYFIIFFFDDQ